MFDITCMTCSFTRSKASRITMNLLMNNRSHWKCWWRTVLPL